MMQNNLQQTQACVEMTRMGSDSLHQVLAEIELVMDFSAQISAAAEQQQAVVEDISQNVNLISQHPMPTAARCRMSTSRARSC